MALFPGLSRSSRGSRRRAGALAVSSLLAAALVGVPALADPSPGSRGVVGPTLPKALTKPATVSTAAKAASKTASKTVSKAKAPAAKKAPKVSGLTLGSRGTQVAELQTRLAELKYDVTETTGYFGDQTYHAVMAFQKINGLSRSGVAGSQTMAALAEATDPEPMLADNVADRIEVDLKRQILMLYRGGALSKILSISSGSGKDFCVIDPETGKSACDKAITPGGSFRVSRRWIGWRESKLGELYNPLYFNGGIAIHGAPSVPGYPASHGCVRIPMISAEWFPNEVENGTAVYVFGGEKAPVPLGAKAPTDTQPAGTRSAASTTAPTSTVVRLLAPTTIAGPPVAAPLPAPTVAPTVLATAPSTTLTAATTTTLAPPGTLGPAPSSSTP